VANDGNFSI